MARPGADGSTLPIGNRLSLAVIVATVLVDMIGFGIVMPVLPQFIMELTGDSLGAAAADAGWLAFAFALAQFIAAPVMGSISDRFGRRAVIIAAMAAFTVNYLLSAVAGSLLMLFVGRILSGITGASYVTAYSYVTDISAPDQRTQNFGLLGMAMGVGFVIGPAVGGFAAQFGPRMPFVVAATLAAINMVAALVFLKESLPPDKRRPFSLARANPASSLTRLARPGPLRGLAVSIFIVHLTLTMLNTIWPFFTLARFGWGPTMVGLSLTFSGMLSAVVRGGVIRPAVRRLGEYRTVLWALAAQIAGLLIMALGWQGWMLFAGIAVYTFAGLAYPALAGLASREVESTEQGELQGALASLTGLAAIIGPLISTRLFEAFTSAGGSAHLPAAPLLTCSALGILSLAMSVRWGSKYNLPRR